MQTFRPGMHAWYGIILIIHALINNAGHGPFSHMFEKVMKEKLEVGICHWMLLQGLA